MLLLLKTGIRRKELVELDLDDINFEDQSIQLKPTPKRTNRTVFFDYETLNQLKRWLRARDNWNHQGSNALFVSRKGARLRGQYLQRKIAEYARIVGLHNPNSKKLEDRFTPHAYRHFFTTVLRRAGMPREFNSRVKGRCEKRGHRYLRSYR